MKRTKIPPLKMNQNDIILINEDEYSDQSRVELLCNSCHTNTLVTITDKTGNSDLFCKRCGTTYDTEDETIRHRQRLSLPLENNEVALSTTPTIGADAVAIRKEKELSGGFAQLAKKGTIRFTSYEERVGRG